MNEESCDRNFRALNRIVREEGGHWHFDPARSGQDYTPVGNIRDRVGSHWTRLVRFAHEMDQTIKSASACDFSPAQSTDSETIRNVSQIREMGYDEISASFYKTYSGFYPDIFDPVFPVFEIVNPMGSIIHQKPGKTVPWHYDNFAFYAQAFNVPDRSKISRFLVFLEDWSWGHYVLIGNSVVHQWSAGDTITWPYRMRHLTSNAGLTPKLTMQVTGL